MQDQTETEKIGAALQAAVTTEATDRCLYCGDPAELVCDECDQKITARNAKLAADERFATELRRRVWFTEKIPDNYRTPDDLLVPQWSRELVTRWDVENRFGVTLQGPADTWKTRAGIMLLEKAFLAGQRLEFHQAGELRREFNRLARDGKDSEFLKELCAIPVLMLDDLGNQAFTETSEEFFLALLEGRSNKRVKTIVTTQFPSDEFVEKASNRRIGIAIARRIGPEFNWIVSTKQKAAASINPPVTPQPR